MTRSEAAKAVLDLSVEVIEKTGGLDITVHRQVKELVALEARWGEAVRAYMAAIA